MADAPTPGSIASVTVEKYDDTRWHAEGEYPADAPAENAGNHIAYFLAWAVRKGWASDELSEDFGELVEDIRDRGADGADLLAAIDDKLTSEDLSPSGQTFAAAHYETYMRLIDERAPSVGFATAYHLPRDRGARLAEDILRSLETGPI